MNLTLPMRSVMLKTAMRMMVVQEPRLQDDIIVSTPGNKVRVTM